MNLDEMDRAIAAVSEFRRKVAILPVTDLSNPKIEKEAQEVTHAVGRALMVDVFKRCDTNAPTVGINGEQWGNRRASKASYQTIFGEVEVERGIYQRSGRGRVAVPLELRMGIMEGRYTPMAAKLMGHAVGVMTASDAAGFLHEAGVLRVSSSTIHRVGANIAANFMQNREQVTTDVRESDPIPMRAASIQVALDGVMVAQDGENAKARGRATDSPKEPRYRTRYELGEILGPAASNDSSGRVWHEATVGTVSFFDEEGHLLKTTYLAQMPESGKTTLASDLKSEAIAVLLERPYLKVSFASDGALHNWTILDDIAAAIPETHEGIVFMLADLYLVALRVSEVAATVSGAGTPEARLMKANWLETLREFEDGPARVLKSMRYHRDRLTSESDVEAVQAAINYIAGQNNKGRLDYARARREMLPIGTGITEAAAKTVVGVRLKRAGARYSQHGGQAIMMFRTAILSERYDLFFRTIHQQYQAEVREAA